MKTLGRNTAAHESTAFIVKEKSVEPGRQQSRKIVAELVESKTPSTPIPRQTFLLRSKTVKLKSLAQPQKEQIEILDSPRKGNVAVQLDTKITDVGSPGSKERVSLVLRNPAGRALLELATRRSDSQPIAGKEEVRVETKTSSSAIGFNLYSRSNKAAQLSLPCDGRSKC